MKFKNAIVMSLPLMLLTACSGGSGSAVGNGSSSDNVISGVDAQFIDAPVEGLNYSSTSYSGVTGSQGSFQCALGEEVVFSVGNTSGTVVNIGSASCGKKVLLENLDTKNHKDKIGAFLQSFGVVGGQIIIPNAVRSASMTPITFSTANTGSIATYINSLALGLTPVSTTDAATHILSSEEQYKLDDDSLIEALREIAHFTTADGNASNEVDPGRFDPDTNVHIAKNLDNADCAIDFYISLYKTYVAQGQTPPREKFYVYAYIPDLVNPGNNPVSLNGVDGGLVSSDVFATKFNVDVSGVAYTGNFSAYLDIPNKRLKGKMNYTVDGKACSASINENIIVD